jgi:hypothetical protein
VINSAPRYAKSGTRFSFLSTPSPRIAGGAPRRWGRVRLGFFGNPFPGNDEREQLISQGIVQKASLARITCVMGI